MPFRNGGLQHNRLRGMSIDETLITTRWKMELAKPGKVDQWKVRLFAFEVERFHLRNPEWSEDSEPDEI